MHYLNRYEGIKRAKKVIRANPNWKDSMNTLIKTRTPCSCAMCSNDRKIIGITHQEQKMELENEVARYHSAKKYKKKTVIVEYRLKPDADKNKFWYSLYPVEWKKWHAYYDLKGANEAIARQADKFDWLEFRLKPEEKK
jgi:hypothetical protein